MSDIVRTPFPKMTPGNAVDIALALLVAYLTFSGRLGSAQVVVGGVGGLLATIGTVGIAIRTVVGTLCILQILLWAVQRGIERVLAMSEPVTEPKIFGPTDEDLARFG